MSIELKLERLYDATPEEVFDAFVDPAAQEELHGSDRPDWKVHRVETDVRVGGTSTYVMGPEGADPDTETREYTVVERPHRLVFRHTMHISEWDRTLSTELTVTFEERDGKTLLTFFQTGFESEADRDAFEEGWADYLDTLGRVLKARHDTP
jgi:uncharacterized protein YndB with AHSA1/START domain